MENAGHLLAVRLGAAVLALSLPACSALSRTQPANPFSTEQPLSRAVALLPPRPAHAGPTSASEDQALPETDHNTLPVAWNNGEASDPCPELLHPWASVDGQTLGQDRLTNVYSRCKHDFDLSVEDYKGYYSPENLGYLALGTALMAPVANTSADREIRRWYQNRVRNETTNEFADVLNYGALFWVVVPAGLEASALLGRTPEDYSNDSGIHEWANRSLRALAVGGPPVVLLELGLGASRPEVGDSRWRPFQDSHGVSGHAFLGAVPFLTAASMTENPYYQYPLFLGSFLSGWARVNDDRHYFSQVALGWWMAYLAVRRVDDTQRACRAVSIIPTFTDGPGIGVLFRY